MLTTQNKYDIISLIEVEIESFPTTYNTSKKSKKLNTIKENILNKELYYYQKKFIKFIIERHLAIFEMFLPEDIPDYLKTNDREYKSKIEDIRDNLF
tara:strand:- start:4413 stop:4703 length:291 start_codon:yes stop_codon:yes gene_type:complete